MAVTRSEKWVAPVRDTATKWTTSNPVIPEGVFCLVTDRIASGSLEYFVGQGNKTYTQLVEAGAIHNYEFLNYKGVANGLATLSSRIKVPTEQLPLTISTATPISTDGENGDLWIVVKD